MKKSIKSVMAFALATSMVASSFAPATTALAAKKTNVITKATYNSGSTVKYSYNGKGLVTKSVSTKSSKGSSSDETVTTTITFKYNKKNKISSKTEKTVKKNTFYETDKTTGLNITANRGTKTTTTTSVTNYKYDKKGLATESETTTTTGISGSTTANTKSRSFYGTEMSDGTFLAGYNSYNADGTYNYENTKANAYFYTGSANSYDSDNTTTVTYTDNGNGTYKKVTVNTTTTNNSPIKKEENAAYYDKSVVDGVVKMTPLTKGTDGKYTSADGTITTYYPDITIISSITLSVDPEGSPSSVTKTTTTDETNTNKIVETTKYSYDKKKRVKKEVTTTVDTSSLTTKETAVEDNKGKTYSSTQTTVTDEYNNDETTSISTTTYTYDKKGRAKKIVTSGDGVKDSVSTFGKKETSYDSQSTTTASDGTSSTYKESRSQNDYGYKDTTVVKNGVSTLTTTHTPFTRINTITYSDGKTKQSTYDYAYSSTGGYKQTETLVDTDGSTTVTASYYFDAYNKAPSFGKRSGSVEVSKAGTPTEVTYGNYNNGITNYNWSTNYEYTDAEKGKAEFEPVKTAFEGSVVASYDEVIETKTDYATPFSATTTYAYDKAGNVKSAKTSGTDTEIVDVVNETYGNTIYEFNATTNKCTAVKKAVTHKYTDKNAMDNTVKKGTKVLTKKITANNDSYDRSTSSGSYLTRVLYTIKNKKASAAKISKKQQWIIQNGALNGEVGLN